MISPIWPAGSFVSSLVTENAHKLLLFLFIIERDLFFWLYIVQEYNEAEKSISNKRELPRQPLLTFQPFCLEFLWIFIIKKNITSLTSHLVLYLNIFLLPGNRILQRTPFHRKACLRFKHPLQVLFSIPCWS